jgi:endogenous inhibitor of DNA gyrase (YacG/DUF329 family)
MAAPVKCAICGKPAVEKFHPFCSARCATLDLGRWLGEGYKVPVVEEDPEEESFVPPENGDKD